MELENYKAEQNMKWEALNDTQKMNVAFQLTIIEVFNQRKLVIIDKLYVNGN